MDDTRISKRLSYVLRHRPDSIGLTLGDDGWIGIDALLAGLAAHGTDLSRDRLARIVAANDKQRFTIDGDRIRANQGHSVPVDLALPPVTPPEVLYHGTATRHLGAIFHEGLRKGSRHHVHLSADADTARPGGRPARYAGGAPSRRRRHARRRAHLPPQRQRRLAHRHRAAGLPDQGRVSERSHRRTGRPPGRKRQRGAAEAGAPAAPRRSRNAQPLRI